MFLYYLESTPAPGRERELHRADCWYLLRQNLNNYELLGCFKYYELAMADVLALDIDTIQKCPFCSI